MYLNLVSYNVVKFIIGNFVVSLVAEFGPGSKVVGTGVVPFFVAISSCFPFVLTSVLMHSLLSVGPNEKTFPILVCQLGI